MMRHSLTMPSVQSAIIPVVNEWIRENPGTLSLGQGMVSYPPPASVMQAIQHFGTQPTDHYYGSAFGMPTLLNVIDTKLLNENAIDCQRGYRVMVTAGSNMGFLNVLLPIVDPGDEVILPLPYYFNQEMAVRMLHCTPIFVPTDGDYQLQIDLLRAAITTKTRAIVTVSPNNPSGAVYPEVDLRAVNALCQQHGLYHISDEAYEYFTYDNAQHFSPGSIAGAGAHTISLYSLSKAYGFASWRMGYLVIPKELVPSLMKAQDTNLICPPLITQHAALAALQTGIAYCKNQLLPLTEVRHYMITQLQGLEHVCQTSVTAGAIYFLLKLNTDRNDLEVLHTLIRDFKIAALPGSAFGLTDGCYLRISYGMLNHASAEIAMQRLIKGITTLC
ncbi:pyridoxal phosphate-dependent aminotransferase [Crenothrix sp.]|uniref:pyridoxal phosphate-dependent aminotransferase n=1 Tax=Crenothrix sp. TaxID=3100433 RepID=UPI00374DBC7E